MEAWVISYYCDINFQENSYFDLTTGLYKPAYLVTVPSQDKLGGLWRNGFRGKNGRWWRWVAD